MELAAHLRWLVGIALAGLVAGCGGGADGPSPTSGSGSRVSASPGRASTGAMPVVTSAQAAEQLLDFAEAGSYRWLFPSREPTRSFGPFLYRHYGATGVYLGVVVAEGQGYGKDGVYVMGGAYGNSPTYVGQVTSFIAPTVPVYALQAPAPATYAAGSDERVIFDDLAATRAAAGVGALRQHAALDRAAQAHAAYIGLHGASHGEVAGKAGFTGTTAADRVVAAGYAYGDAADEVIGGGADAHGCVASLMNSVFHRGHVLNRTRDVGIGVTASKYGTTCVVNLGVASGVEPQAPDTASLTLWPSPGATGVPVGFFAAGETPHPAPDLGTTWTGSPVSVCMCWHGAPFWAYEYSVQRFELRDAAGVLVPARLLANSATASGPGVRLTASQLAAGEAYLLPLSPLSPGVTYTVDFKAAAGGVGYHRTWTFTTAP